MVRLGGHYIIGARCGGFWQEPALIAGGETPDHTVIAPLLDEKIDKMKDAYLMIDQASYNLKALTLLKNKIFVLYCVGHAVANVLKTHLKRKEGRVYRLVTLLRQAFFSGRVIIRHIIRKFAIKLKKSMMYEMNLSLCLVVTKKGLSYSCLCAEHSTHGRRRPARREAGYL